MRRARRDDLPVLAVGPRRRAGPGARARARAAQARRRRARLGPCDGPPPEPGITSRRAERASATSQRLDRADRAGQGRRGAHARGAARIRARRRAPARAARRPARPQPRSSGSDGPMVGTFHAADAGRNAWYEALSVPLRAMVARARRCAPRCRRRRSATVEAAFGETLRDPARTASSRARSRSAEPSPTRGPPCCSSGATSRARGSRCCSTRGRSSTATPILWVAGDGPQTDDAAAAVARRTSSGSDRITDDEKARRLRGADRRSARRRSAGSRSASCCSRRWPPAPRSSRPTSPATATSRAPTARRCSSPPGDVDGAARRAPAPARRADAPATSCVDGRRAAGRGVLDARGSPSAPAGLRDARSIRRATARPVVDAMTDPG